jgi:hypothetical protein
MIEATTSDFYRWLIAAGLMVYDKDLNQMVFQYVLDAQSYPTYK